MGNPWPAAPPSTTFDPLETHSRSSIQWEFDNPDEMRNVNGNKDPNGTDIILDRKLLSIVAASMNETKLKVNVT